GHGTIAFEARRGIERDPDRLAVRALADVSLDPAMRVLLPDVHGLGQVVPVPALEAVDQAAGDVDGPEQQRQRAGEILAMPLLAVDEEVLDGVEFGVDLLHLEGVAEPPRVEEVRLHRPGPGDGPLRAALLL